MLATATIGCQEADGRRSEKGYRCLCQCYTEQRCASPSSDGSSTTETAPTAARIRQARRHVIPEMMWVRRVRERRPFSSSSTAWCYRASRSSSGLRMNLKRHPHCSTTKKPGADEIHRDLARLHQRSSPSLAYGPSPDLVGRDPTAPPAAAIEALASAASLFATSAACRAFSAAAAACLSSSR